MTQWLIEAYKQAAKCEDPSTQNGAVLVDERGWVIGQGYTRIHPTACVTPERWERPEKYKWVTHAEQDAIFDAIRDAFDAKGCTLYACWAACEVCAKTIVGCGVSRLVRHVHPAQRVRHDWADAIRVGDEMMRAAGVEIVDVDEVLGASIRFGGVQVEV